MKKLLGIFAGICLCVCASEGRAEETLPELSKAGHEAFDDLIEGRAMLERCAEGDKPCPLKLTELHKKIRAEYSVNDQCKAQFRYHFYEIDCGADGVPDLLLQYRGTCIYDRGEDENSGRDIMIYRDGNGKYRVGSEVEFWERSTFEFTDRSFYRAYGSCGADCFISESGFFDSKCQQQKISYVYHDGGDDETLRVETEREVLVLLKVLIDGKGYYRFWYNVEDSEVLALRQVAARIERFVPKAFRGSFDVVPKILVEEEEARLIEAAKAARRSGK
ncbi:MAG: hypothetical protein II767_07225 [Proteobacteria bacterium]|nr:hypothetical protein [Pseudomonadota bacterium]